MPNLLYCPPGKVPTVHSYWSSQILILIICIVAFQTISALMKVLEQCIIFFKFISKHFLMKFISQIGRFSLICTNDLFQNSFCIKKMWFQKCLVSQNTEFLLGKSGILFLCKHWFQLDTSGWWHKYNKTYTQKINWKMRNDVSQL